MKVSKKARKQLKSKEIKDHKAGRKPSNCSSANRFAKRRKKAYKKVSGGKVLYNLD